MLPAYGGEAALRGAFFTSLKESAVVCRGSAQRVMEMAAGAQVRCLVCHLEKLPAAAGGGTWRSCLLLSGV